MQNRIVTVIVTIFLFWLLLWGCAKKPVWVPEHAAPDEILFSKAEKLFQEKFYKKAFQAYNDYLVQYPDTDLAPAALMKIGDIYSAIGDYPEAREAYSRLIDKYPGSFIVQEAMVEILSTFFYQGRYNEVLENASDVLIKINSRTTLFRAYALIGDAYLQIGSYADAVSSYTKAYKKSKGLETKNITAKLKQAVRKLDLPDIEYLLKHLDKKNMPRNYLMYQLGLKKIEQRDYEGSVTVLTEFVTRFPEDENFYQARILLDKLKNNTVFRHSTIGCLLPLSGSYKIIGEKALRGIELALSVFDSQNSGTSINIIIKDSCSDSDKAVLSVREFFEEEVAAIIGPVFTAESAALEAQEKGIPILVLTQKDNITDIGENVFRNFLTPKMQVHSLVSYAVNDLGMKNFAILYPEENYGIKFMKLFWDEVTAQGGKITGLESYNSNQTDFADSIKKLAGLYYEIPEDLEDQEYPEEPENSEDIIVEDIDDNSGEADQEENAAEDTENVEELEPQPIIDFEAIFIPDALKKAGLIIPQLTFHDVTGVQLLGTNLWHSQKLVKMAKQYAQSAVISDGFFEYSSSADVRKFVKIFQKTFGERPGFIEAVAYDSAMILFKAASNQNIRFKSELINEIIGVKDFQGVTGHTSFDQDREAVKKLFLFRLKGKRFVEIKH